RERTTSATRPTTPPGKDRTPQTTRERKRFRDHCEALAMRSRCSWPFILVLTAILAGPRPASAGEVTLSHSSSALPGAPGPAITLLSITGKNDGTNYTFTLTFANPTIEGPSSGNADAVYGFINMDT